MQQVLNDFGVSQSIAEDCFGTKRNLVLCDETAEQRLFFVG